MEGVNLHYLRMCAHNTLGIFENGRGENVKSSGTGSVFEKGL